jgi:surfeit locus 1 family protein
MPRSRLPLSIALVVFAAVCARLGVWQLDRLAARQAANDAAAARRALPEVRLPSSIPAESLDGRNVRATGEYDRRGELILRGQVFSGVPGVVLVTPLRLDGAGDTAVLVERGFVPSPDALALPSDTGLDEPGARDVRGIAFAIADSGHGEPLERGGRLSLRRLDLGVARQRSPHPLLAVVIRQSPDSPSAGFPRRRPAPVLDEGPHLVYAIQWFAFALTALVFGAVYLRKRGGIEKQTSR